MYKEVKKYIREQVILDIDMTRECPDEMLMKCINEKLLEYPEYISFKDKVRLQRDIYNSLRRFDILSELLEDESITDIMVNGPENIFIDKSGKMVKTDYSFESAEKLDNVIQHIVASHNRIVNESKPIVDARMPDGSRVNIVLPPIAINGPVITIRKFPKMDFTMDKFIEMGTITGEAAHFLQILVEAKYNVFISGGTGSGKTTFLNVLSGFIPSGERIITIEDSAELRIQGIDNIVRLETRNANLEGDGEITMSDLIKSSLRMIPSRIIIGEIRGGEALDMIQAMNTGHDGSLSTGHANSAMDMINRLETLILTARDFPMEAVKRQVGSAIDIMIHLGRLKDRTRRVMEISEVCFEKDEIVLNKLYEFDEEVRNDGCVYEGRLVRTKNQMRYTDKLKRAGFSYEKI